MRTFPIRVSIVVVLLIALLPGMRAVSQEASPAPADHPLAGAWLIDLHEEGGRLVTFSADGTALFTDVDGTGQGAWEPTGDTTADFTIWQLATEQFDEGPIFTGYFLLSGEIDVDAEGSWTGDLTLALIDREGAVAGMDGPFTVSATRLPVMHADQIVPGDIVVGAATPAP
jgi:hypothetical protein